MLLHLDCGCLSFNQTESLCADDGTAVLFLTLSYYILKCIRQGVRGGTVGSAIASQLEGPGFDSHRGKLWALAVCPTLCVIGTHTQEGRGWPKGLSVWSLHVLPVSPWVRTTYPHKNMQQVKSKMGYKTVGSKNMKKKKESGTQMTKILQER